MISSQELKFDLVYFFSRNDVDIVEIQAPKTVFFNKKDRESMILRLEKENFQRDRYEKSVIFTFSSIWVCERGGGGGVRG